MKYIRNLHHIDDRVLSVSPQTGKDTRVFVGIVIVCGSKIEVDGKLLGVLNFNLMIPIEEAQLQPIDLIVRRRDRSEIIRYKELCQKELEWCHRHSEVICNKANVLYKAYISDDTFSARDRCLDFHKMEAECKKFNTKAPEEAIRKEYENGSLYPQ